MGIKREQGFQSLSKALESMNNVDQVSIGFALLALMVSLVSLVSSISINGRLNRYVKHYHNVYGRIENSDFGQSSFSASSMESSLVEG